MFTYFLRILIQKSIDLRAALYFTLNPTINKSMFDFDSVITSLSKKNPA